MGGEERQALVAAAACCRSSPGERWALQLVAAATSKATLPRPRVTKRRRRCTAWRLPCARTFQLRRPSAAVQSKSAAPPVSGSRPLRPFSTSELAAREVLRRQPGLQVLVGCVRRMTGDDVPPSDVPPRARHKSPFFVLYHPELKTGRHARTQPARKEMAARCHPTLPPVHHTKERSLAVAATPSPTPLQHGTAELGACIFA